MALVVKDRVRQTTTTAGTGTVTLNGTVVGFQSFSVIGDGNTTYYAIVDAATGDWEVGIGTYTLSGTTLSRDSVLESSNSGSLVPFAAGTKDVFCTYPAERSVYVDGSSIVPATAATLPTVSGGTGLSSFTANGIVYASSTSALATGSALTFDGSTLATTGALQVDGNTTLGNASTDTVQVNGYMGVGGAPASSIGLYVRNTALTGTTQVGVWSAPVSTNAATNQTNAFVSQPTTSAAAYTANSVTGFRAENAVLGSGSTITNQYGVYIADQTQGTNNYGITSLVSSGTNKWNIYASGTAANYFAGKALVGTTTDQDGRLIIRSTGNTYANSAVAIVDSANTTKLQMVQTTSGFFYMTVNGTDDFVLKPTESVFNESGADIDFRVESDTNTHALFLEGSSGNVGIGTSSPGATLNVAGVIRSTRADFSKIELENTTSASFWVAQNSAGSYTLGNGATASTTERLRIDSSGNVLIGKTTTSTTTDGLRIYSGEITATLSSTSTNLATASGGTLRLVNSSATDGNFSNIGGYNSNGLVTSQIDFININHASRTGAIAFLTHDGSSMPERMRINASGNVGIGTSSPSNSARLDAAGSVISTAATLGTFNANNAGFDFVAASKIGRFYATSTDTTGGVMTFTTGQNGSYAERMRIDSSGNVGIGVTPSAWDSGFQVLQNSGGALWSGGSSVSVRLTQNTYYATTYKYVSTAAAAMYAQVSGVHYWYTAPSGTAGNAITFTQAMTLDASGRLLVGLTSTNTAFGGKLQVEGTSDAFASLVRYSSSAASNPAFYFGRSKSATLGTNTIVASGDALGAIVFSGANGTGYSDAAYIQGFVDGTPGASADMPGRLVFATSADGSATPTERMRIDSSGNVGIGTSSPQFKLDTRVTDNTAYTTSSTANILSLRNESTTAGTYSGMQFVAVGNGADVGAAHINAIQTASGSAALAFSTRNSATTAERMRIDSAGNVGIGITSPTGLLDVYKAAQGGSSTFRAYGPAGQILWANGGASTSYLDSDTIIFRASANSSNTERARIDASGFTQFSSNLVMPYQGAPTSKSGAATLTGAELVTGILNTTGTTYTITLPTGTNIEGALTWSANNVCLDWWVINTASGTITIGANGNTTLGSLTIATGTSAHFRIRRTAANTFTVYRLG